MPSSTIRAAAGISLVTLVSRVLGLVRDVLMIRTLGFSWATGTFALAWMVPNLLRRLFGEGAISASFVPIYARTVKREGPDAARRLLGSITALLLLVLGGLTAAVLLSCWWVPAEWVGKASVDSSGDVSAHQQGRLLLDLTIILFPYAIPICLAAIFAGALNTHGSFALPAAAPVVLNVFWIAALALVWALALRDPTLVVSLVAMFLLAGGLAQMALSLVPLLRHRRVGPLHFPQSGDPARQVLRNMAPTVVGMSLVQLSTILDQTLALYLIDPNAPSFLYTANRLLLFPHALTSLSLATAVFPRFAELGGDGDLAGLRRHLDKACRHTLRVAVPATLGMMLVAPGLIETMFAGERTTAHDLDTAAHTTMCMVASLPAIGVAQLHARALYALGEYRFAAVVSFWLLCINAVLDFALVLGLGFGAPGLALATTVASWLHAAVLRRRVHRSGAQGEPWDLGKTVLATVVMGVAVWGVLQLTGAQSRLGTLTLRVALPMACGVFCYGGVLWLLGVRHVKMR
ncbi:MAG: murein biosynthesis integral membrane protein MurJ [Planctomycetes bacterium]|nr:murein biosynthesis integral membrane protein MurJ [Planctomycetota bacterium]MCB9870326.1 murein biosynthesis integral membrane protein MurJ [Planctomycetota bacterium]MCB9888095.1 murein biosynthesis integral membrane protein MurJ [Planctomycetota bacterium]